MSGIFIRSTCISFDNWVDGFEESRIGGAGLWTKEVVSIVCAGFSGPFDDVRGGN